jgi:hypothetical protein|tara:strand:+ start:1610 stop:1825 length:216 start_codon:yes stop_codon:yes gene_type:complete
MSGKWRKKMSRPFRATLVDTKNPDRNIVYEFEAPFPVDPQVDYVQWAIQALLYSLTTGEIKITDIEPVEMK